MKSSKWLSTREIRTLAVGLITPEMSTRVTQRLSYIQRKYSEVNDSQIFEIILNVLEGFQQQIDGTLITVAKQVESPFNDGLRASLPMSADEQAKAEKMAKEMLEMSLDDRISHLRKSYLFNRYVLYGPPISDVRGIKGEITWNEVDQVRQLVLAFMQEKENRSNGNEKQDIVSSSQPVNQSGQDDNQKEEKFNKALIRLKVFEGKNLMSTKIMNDGDYSRMVEYVHYMIDKEKLPESIEPVPSTGLSNSFIRYTFYLIHKELYSTIKIRDYFIDFIHAFFKQFSQSYPTTTKIKFSTPPNSYHEDVEKMAKL